jgi:hypothetical protein
MKAICRFMACLTGPGACHEFAHQALGEREVFRGDLRGDLRPAFRYCRDKLLVLADGDMSDFVCIRFGTEVERDPGAQVDRKVDEDRIARRLRHGMMQR